MSSIAATTELPFPVSMTASAAKRIAEIIREDGKPGLMLRIAVSGGGCSGFQYGFTLDTEKTADDIAIERDGVTLLVDTTSLEFMKGAEVDFTEDMMGAAFQIKNPNATSKCGCGSSFSVG